KMKTHDTDDDDVFVVEMDHYVVKISLNKYKESIANLDKCEGILIELNKQLESKPNNNITFKNIYCLT
ncbi:12038_t:CDS:2, partial [Cetraspora pellucida]